MSGVTARDVLLGGGAGRPPAPGSVAQRPAWRGVLDRLEGPLKAVSAAGRRVVDRQLAAAIDQVLEVDLGQTLIGAWRTHSDLISAARTTRANPDRSETVTLAAHDVTASHHPYVEVVVNGLTLARLHWDLGIRLEVEGLVAVVRGGRLTELRGGGLGASVTFGCEGYEVAAGRLVGLDPRLVVTVGSGIGLLPEDRHPTPA
jgi:hypothetical protein